MWALVDMAQKAVKLDAFGAPFSWVRSNVGEEEAFFGSDRVYFEREYLGIPWNDMVVMRNAKLGDVPSRSCPLHYQTMALYATREKSRTWIETVLIALS